jgi:hypothetical protein
MKNIYRLMEKELLGSFTTEEILDYLCFCRDIHVVNVCDRSEYDDLLECTLTEDEWFTFVHEVQTDYDSRADITLMFASWFLGWDEDSSK